MRESNIKSILEVTNVTNITHSNDKLVEKLKGAVFDGNTTELCDYMTKHYWTAVTFRLASSNAMRLYQDVKVTFSDKIATFGKTNVNVLI